MKLLASSLKRTPIFADLTLQQVEQIIRQTPLLTAHAGNPITAPENAVKHHLLILDGNIKTNNKWLFYGNEMQYCWQLQSDESRCRFAILSSATRAINATATSATRYMFIDGDLVDRLGQLKHPLPTRKSSALQQQDFELLDLTA
jgi:hypothetical protein